MQAMIDVPMDGQMLKLVIESCQSSAKSEGSTLKRVYFLSIADTLTKKLKEFHAMSGGILTEKYPFENEKAAAETATD